jgi:hypothetical protein
MFIIEGVHNISPLPLEQPVLELEGWINLLGGHLLVSK